MDTKEQLEAAVKVAEKDLAAAKFALEFYLDSPENNTFEDLEEAREEIEYKLCEKAGEDCEGSYNCGAEVYEQEFIVQGIHYLGTLYCEYNRHDKTYYYLDGHKFKYEEIINEESE